jgi:TonB family protein
MKTASWLLLLLQIALPRSTPEFPRLITADPPRPPLQTVVTGIVVLDGYINEGMKLTDIRTLFGQPPFIEPSRQVINEWMFTGHSARASERTGVVFLYRSRGMLPENSFAFSLQNSCCPDGNSPPLPRFVVDPGYPPRSIAEGVVVLQVSVSMTGKIEKLDIIRPQPSLTEAATNAVSAWKFDPATDQARPVAGTVIVAISFLRPVLATP